MEKDVIGNTTSLDVEPILPDGWQEGDDIFANAPVETGDDAPLADELRVGDDLSALLDEEAGKDDNGAPTTGNQEPSEEPSAETKAAEQTDGAAAPQSVSRLLKLKVNHKEETVDVNKMTDEELIAAIQKSRAYDARTEADNKKRFREVFQAQVDAGMTEDVAKMVAQSAAGGKDYALTDEEEAAAIIQEAQEKPAAQEKPTRDFEEEVRILKAIYPDFTTMPQEVIDAYRNGAPLYAAYGAYQHKQDAKAADAIRKERDILRQNAASAKRAPVSGVSGGGATPDKPDPFLKGFESDPW